ncbi:MAG TPA: protein kinase, partial [Streptosporangiaceae bacterium]|nr:protein kinase [Streptosporangiaceae bacterium]
ARDEVLARDVAVKVLSPQFAADPGFLSRFEREARHIAAVSHPRIVTVFDCGVDRGNPYIVMELVVGRTLRQVLDEVGGLPIDHAVSIAAAVCEALAAAHSAGLVHRDIKPANIVLSGSDVKVLDFGIAGTEDAAGRTRTQAVLGTAAYLPPERAADGPAGPQADLYSLGCVLFEMLTGSPPFTGDSSVGVAYRHVHEDPGPPSMRRPGVPAQLDRITAQLLAKDPSARPPGAAAARNGLLATLARDHSAARDYTAARDHTAVLGPAPGTMPTDAGSRLPPRRRRSVETFLALALAGALAALAFVLVSNRSHPPGSVGTPPGPAATHGSQPTPSPSTTQPSTVSPVAAAAGSLVTDLQVGVADGQVTPGAAKDLFNQLQQLLFNSLDQNGGQNAGQTDQRYSQLVQSFDNREAHGDINGPAAGVLRHDLDQLGMAVGAL